MSNYADSEFEELVCDVMALVSVGDAIPVDLAKDVLAETIRCRCKLKWIETVFAQHAENLDRLICNLSDSIDSTQNSFSGESEVVLQAYLDCTNESAVDEVIDETTD